MVARNNKYNKPATDERWRHVHLSLNFLELLKGVNLSDQCVKDTLKVKYEVDLTEKELLDFVNYLIAHNPQYPSSSEREHSRSGKRICLYKKPEVFQQAYLEYKATKKRCFIFQIPGSLRLAVLYLYSTNWQLASSSLARKSHRDHCPLYLWRNADVSAVCDYDAVADCEA